MDGNPDVDMYCNMHKWGASKPIARLFMGNSPKTQFMGNCPEEGLVGCKQAHCKKCTVGNRPKKARYRKKKCRQARGSKHFDKHIKGM